MNMYNNQNHHKSNKLVPGVLMAIWGAAAAYAVWSSIHGFAVKWFDIYDIEYGLSGFLYGFFYAAIFAGSASFLFAVIILVCNKALGSRRKSGSIGSTGNVNNGYIGYNAYSSYNNCNTTRGYNGFNTNSDYNGYNVYNTNNGNNIRRW